MTYKAIIFDMDGVIIDSKEQVEQFWNEKFEQYGIVPQESRQELELKYHGRPARLIIEDFFRDLPEEERRKILEECARADASVVEYPLIPGVEELIGKCMELKVRIGLVTSALPDKVKLMLRSLRYDSPFRTIVTADRVENGKPDPECYLLAAKEMGVKAEESIVFEDSMSGVQAATGAGSVVIGINQPRVAAVLRNSGAELVIPDFRSAKIENEQSDIRLFPDYNQSETSFVLSKNE